MLEQREDAFVDADGSPDDPVDPVISLEPATLEAPDEAPDKVPDEVPASSGHATLQYQLLGPSLTKAGQDAVDQQKVSVSATQSSRYRQASAVVAGASLLYHCFPLFPVMP